MYLYIYVKIYICIHIYLKYLTRGQNILLQKSLDVSSLENKTLIKTTIYGKILKIAMLLLWAVAVGLIMNMTKVIL